MKRRWPTFLGLAAALVCSWPARTLAQEGEPKLLRPGGNEEAWAGRKTTGGVGHAGVEARGFAGRGFGVRPFVADGTAGQGQSTTGIVARERGTGLLSTRWLSARYADELWLGYDGVDFSARALMDASFGFRLPVTPYSGPVARVALFAEVTQLVGWNKTELRLGVGELGWSYARGAGHLDLVLQLGPTLLGQVGLGTTQRSLSGLTWGALLSSGWEELLFDLRINQIAQDSAAGPVTDLRAEVCGLLGGREARPTKTTRGKDARAFVGPKARDFRASLCADVSYGSAAADPASEGTEGTTRWTTIGLSILIGPSSRLDPLPRLGL